MKISVIIPSYNSWLSLPATLKALKQQVVEGQFEVIVVDCSDDAAVAEICERHPAVRYHHVEERFNPGIGRNLGAEIATGELLVFLDSDVVLLGNSLQRARAYFEEGNSIFGGALELNEEMTVGVASYLEHYFFNHESQRGRPQCSRANLSSALMCVSRELFLGAGGFKDIPRMQDTELTERLRKAGQELSFNPQVVGLQTQDSSLNKVLRKIMINGKNLYIIRYKRRSLGLQALLFLSLPLVAALKVLRIVLRHLRYQDARGKGVTLLLSPWLGVAGGVWMFGLYHSMLTQREMGAARD